MINWPLFVELVRPHRRFVLTTHVRPDGDALGSQLAMARILESLGKEVRRVNAFAVPPSLRFLDPAQGALQLGEGISLADAADCDVLMILDTSAWAQLGGMGEVIRATSAKKAVLDHHVSEDDLGAEVFKDTSAEATGRLVVDAAHQLGVALTPAIAHPAFVALATDTGWFRFASTSAGTLHTAAELVEAGVAPDAVYRELYENDTLGRLRLIGIALGRAQRELDGRLIYTWLTQADFAAAGAIPPDSEDIINLTLAVGGTQAAVILVEQPKGGFKISLRSRSELDVRLVAEQFGGGGHRKAAGASLSGPLEPALQQILDAMRAAMR